MSVALKPDTQDPAFPQSGTILSLFFPTSGKNTGKKLEGGNNSEVCTLHI